MFVHSKKFFDKKKLFIPVEVIKKQVIEKKS